jgi:hypothetical protein
VIAIRGSGLQGEMGSVPRACLPLIGSLVADGSYIRFVPPRKVEGWGAGQARAGREASFMMMADSDGRGQSRGEGTAQELHIARQR